MVSYRKIGKYGSCMTHTAQGNDFELILTVKMETTHPTEESFGSGFPAIWVNAALWRNEVARRWNFVFNFCVFLENDPYGIILKILFQKFSPPHQSTLLCSNLADGKSAKSCIIYQTKTKFRLSLKLSLLRRSRPKSYRASSQQCTQSDPDFIQIRSLSAELQMKAWTPPNHALNWIQYSAEA